MRLEEAINKYHGEWIAFRPFDKEDNSEGEILLHHKDRRTFDKKLVEHGIKNVYITFAGPLVPQGYAVMF